MPPRSTTNHRRSSTITSPAQPRPAVASSGTGRSGRDAATAEPTMGRPASSRTRRGRAAPGATHLVTYAPARGGGATGGYPSWRGSRCGVDGHRCQPRRFHWHGARRSGEPGQLPRRSCAASSSGSITPIRTTLTAWRGRQSGTPGATQTRTSTYGLIGRRPSSRATPTSAIWTSATCGARRLTDGLCSRRSGVRRRSPRDRPDSLWGRGIPLPSRKSPP